MGPYLRYLQQSPAARSYQKKGAAMPELEQGAAAGLRSASHRACFGSHMSRFGGSQGPKQL